MRKISVSIAETTGRRSRFSGRLGTGDEVGIPSGEILMIRRSVL
jgi:hypothetical protein